MSANLPARVSLAVAVAVALGVSRASAAPRLDVANVQGRDAPWVVGWNEAVVQLDNSDGAPWRGDVAIDPSLEHHGSDRASVRIPVTLAAGEGARLLVPFFLHAGTWPTVVLSGAGDGTLATQALGLAHPVDGIASIVEVQGTTARGQKLVEAPPPGAEGDDADGEKVPSGVLPHGYKGRGGGGMPTPSPRGEVKGPTAPGAGTGTTAPTPTVYTVQFARETGDPLLPDVGVGWSGAVLVVIPSDILARLQGRPLDALSDWVLSGGSLAVALRREEDLRSDSLVRLVGRDVRLVSSPRSETSTFSGGAIRRGSVPATETGGDVGDVAPYGMGDVWLLRREPWVGTGTAAGGETTAAKAIYGLWKRAKDRRPSAMSLPFGRGVPWVDDARVRRLLDPNFGFRPSLGIAAILVAAYAFLIGPLTFARARRLGRPLSVLRVAPLLAFALFAMLVGLGKIGKGVRGRVRRLTIVDAAAGADRGAATTFHSFYVGDPSAITLPASHPADALHVVEPGSESAPVDADRTGLVVRNVRAHPWQTVVVSEEGTRELEGGIVLEGSESRLALINKTPWTLRHVILHPDDPTSPTKSYYFASVAPGEKVIAREGSAVLRRIIRWSPITTPADHAAGWDGEDGPGGPGQDVLAAADALATASFAFGAAPLPPGQPMATALLSLSAPSGAGAARREESGFGVERDLAFVRVVGLGGGKGKGELPPEPSKKDVDL